MCLFNCAVHIFGVFTLLVSSFTDVEADLVVFGELYADTALKIIADTHNMFKQSDLTKNCIVLLLNRDQMNWAFDIEWRQFRTIYTHM